MKIWKLRELTLAIVHSLMTLLLIIMDLIVTFHSDFYTFTSIYMIIISILYIFIFLILECVYFANEINFLTTKILLGCLIIVTVFLCFRIN